MDVSRHCLSPAWDAYRYLCYNALYLFYKTIYFLKIPIVSERRITLGDFMKMILCNVVANICSNAVILQHGRMYRIPNICCIQNTLGV